MNEEPAPVVCSVSIEMMKPMSIDVFQVDDFPAQELVEPTKITTQLHQRKPKPPPSRSHYQPITLTSLAELREEAKRLYGGSALTSRESAENVDTEDQIVTVSGMDVMPSLSSSRTSNGLSGSFKTLSMADEARFKTVLKEHRISFRMKEERKSGKLSTSQVLKKTELETRLAIRKWLLLRVFPPESSDETVLLEESSQLLAPNSKMNESMEMILKRKDGRKYFAQALNQQREETMVVKTEQAWAELCEKTEFAIVEAACEKEWRTVIQLVHMAATFYIRRRGNDQEEYFIQEYLAKRQHIRFWKQKEFWSEMYYGKSISPLDYFMV